MPSWRPGRAFWTATQTGTKTGFRGCGGRREITDILLFRGRGGTNRPAIDTATHDADEKLPVKARIARQPGSRTNLPIEIHGDLIIAAPGGGGDDMDVFGPCSGTMFRLARATSANVQQFSCRGLTLFNESYACPPPPLCGMSGVLHPIFDRLQPVPQRGIPGVCG